MSASDRPVSVQPLAGAIGAEVHGIDLRDLDETTWEEIHRLWLEHLVLFFPAQELSPGDHVRFAGRFGPLEAHPFLDRLSDEHPEIVVISSDAGAASNWHTDVTFKHDPPKASVLRMAECPTRGGDTIWMNQGAACEALSGPIRDLLDGLTAIHTAKGFGQPERQAEHPVVIDHPETGRRALYVNRAFTSHIAQIRPAESDALLQFLFAWCERPEFQCRYRWTRGTVAVWDNRCTQHYAVADYSEHRRIERVTVRGQRPQGGDSRWPRYDGDPLELYRSHSHVNPPSPENLLKNLVGG